MPQPQSAPEMVTLDGNEAAAYVAHLTNEVIAIYPITPASPMGEWSDEWSSLGIENLWGTVPDVIEMQSEAGAAGAIHGALQGGSLATTFTASQGLLLMIPNMYKIAGELTPTVLHVSARSLAAQALSIFGDHSDVMACRATGYVMLCSANVQEVMDFALISQAATLESRVPFLHFFDGFRTSHEVTKIERLSRDQVRAMIDEQQVTACRARALNPDHPVIRGTSQNPDVYFQGRETVNRYYDAVPGIVQSVMDRFAALTGRQYGLFEYLGAPDAERVILLMGSGIGAAEEAVQTLVAQGERVGLIKVRLFRPFDPGRLLAALPVTATRLAVLDRSKEPGADGEPLYKDVVTALAQAMADGRLATMPRVCGGRFGLSSKEFTPAMVKGVFDELARDQPKRQFTVGHPRRRHPPEPALGPGVPTRGPRRHRLRLLWPGLRRHRVGEQELHQDHQRGDAQLRPGLFRVRLQEGRRRHREPSALRPPAHPQHLSHRGRSGELRGLPPADLPHPLRHAGQGQGRRDLPAQLTDPAGPGVGRPAAAHAAADHRQGPQGLLHRRLRHRRPDRHGSAHQHHHADLLLRHLGDPPPRRGHRPDQGGGQEDLRKEGPAPARAQLCRDRRDPRRAA